MTPENVQVHIHFSYYYHDNFSLSICCLFFECLFWDEKKTPLSSVCFFNMSEVIVFIKIH